MLSVGYLYVASGFGTFFFWVASCVSVCVCILIICMKSLLSPSASGICGTDSSGEVNECHCISEKELFHAITLKVYERTE